MNKKSTTVLFALLLAACSSPSGQAPPNQQGDAHVQIGTPVWITKGDASREQYEMLAAADPADRRHMIACTTVFSKALNARSNVIYISSDGGATWSPSFEDKASVFTGDPACTFGFNGTAYYAGLPIFDGTHLTSSLHIFQSSDYGRTWHLIVTRPFEDREYITVDHTNSPYRGNVYFYADGIGRVVNHKADAFNVFRIEHGKLTAPVASPDSTKFLSMNASEGAIALDGTLVIPFEAVRIAGTQFRILRVTHGGDTVLPSVLIGDVCKRFGGVASPLAVDQSTGPFHGRLYAAYSEQNVDHCTLAIVHSDDNGATWSKPASIHEDDTYSGFPLPPNESMPALAVNGKGVVGLSWYDTRDDAAGKAYKLRFAASYDGGESFTSSVPVSNNSEDIAKSNPFFFGAYVGSGGASASKTVTNEPLESMTGADWMTFERPGDTRAMIVGPGDIFHPFWYDSETGSTQLYTAPVTVAGKAWKNGDPSLDSLTDVTKRVTLRYTSTNFDAASGTVTLGTALVNRSNVPIYGPVKMRLLWAESPAGIPVAVNAQNHRSGPGAIWDISGELPSGELKPWTESRPLTIVFRLDDLDGSRIAFPTLTFGSRVYAATK